MWPSELLERRAAKRRYDAATAVLLSANAYAKLSSPERIRVDAELAKLLGDAGVSTVESRRFAPWSARALERGRAMARLGMGTGVPGEARPKVFRRPRFSAGPITIAVVFRRTSAETVQGRAPSRSWRRRTVAITFGCLLRRGLCQPSQARSATTGALESRC